MLDLCVDYERTEAYGHFGRDEQEFAGSANRAALLAMPPGSSVGRERFRLSRQTARRCARRPRHRRRHGCAGKQASKECRRTIHELGPRASLRSGCQGMALGAKLSADPFENGYGVLAMQTDRGVPRDAMRRRARTLGRGDIGTHNIFRDSLGFLPQRVAYS